jgi:DNA polymerase
LQELSRGDGHFQRRMAALPITSLKDLAKAEAECTRCPLYKYATQVEPFVGPAGRILDRALADAGIDRRQVFVTNAVKHFKFEQRGKRRLHKKPNAYEVERCHFWLDLERQIIKPELTVALGVTAARSVCGRPVTISKVRGSVLSLADGSQVIVTIHPSALLRMPDEATKAAEYRRFVQDLRAGGKLLAEAA